jgi:hypothetical protein
MVPALISAIKVNRPCFYRDLLGLLPGTGPKRAPRLKEIG